MLFLRCGEWVSLRSDRGILPEGEFIEEVGGTDAGQRRNQVFVSDIGCCQSEVVAQGSGEDVGLLADQHRVGGRVHGARGRPVDPGDECCQRRLPGSRGAHHGDALPGGDVQGDVVEDVGGALIGEPYGGDTDTASGTAVGLLLFLRYVGGIRNVRAGTEIGDPDDAGQ